MRGAPLVPHLEPRPGHTRAPPLDREEPPVGDKTLMQLEITAEAEVIKAADIAAQDDTEENEDER